MRVRCLGPGDESALEAFLVRHATSSMFLRSNLHAAGLVDRGAIYHGTYAAAFDGDQVVAAAGHFANGALIVQAPTMLADVVTAAAGASGRPVRLILGPWRQAVDTRDALGLDAAGMRKVNREVLFALDLGDLVVPDALATGHVRCRRPGDREIDGLVEWRVAYSIEELAAVDGPELRGQCASDVAVMHRERRLWVAVNADDRPVGCSTFNARLPDIVQIGGVFTAPALRSRGYARSVVAGALLVARAEGVARAILFTGEENVAAQRAYRAIGFREVGDYGLMIF